MPRLAPDLNYEALDHEDPALLHRWSIFAEPQTTSMVWQLPLVTSQDRHAMHHPEDLMPFQIFNMKNDSLRTSALREVGGFDEHLDTLSACLYQDTEMGLRLTHRGARFGHTKRAPVRLVPARSVMRHIRKAMLDWAPLLDYMNVVQQRAIDGNLQPGTPAPFFAEASNA